MSPYYDQPALRQRGPEDVAGFWFCSPALCSPSRGMLLFHASISATNSALKSSCTSPSCFSAEAFSSHNWLVGDEERGELATPCHPNSGIERRGNSP